MSLPHPPVVSNANSQLSTRPWHPVLSICLSISLSIAVAYLFLIAVASFSARAASRSSLESSLESSLIHRLLWNCQVNHPPLLIHRFEAHDVRSSVLCLLLPIRLPAPMIRLLHHLLHAPLPRLPEQHLDQILECVVRDPHLFALPQPLTQYWLMYVCVCVCVCACAFAYVCDCVGVLGGWGGIMMRPCASHTKRTAFIEQRTRRPIRSKGGVFQAKHCAKR